MSKIEYLNFTISVMALVVAIYSVLYSRRFNRPKISVDNVIIENRKDNIQSISFRVVNLSPTPIQLYSINFKNDLISINSIDDYEPPITKVRGIYGMIEEKFPSLSDFPDTLESSTSLLPHSEISFMYFVKKLNNQLTITVECDRRIHHFKKTQSFSFDVNKHTQQY